MSRVQLLRAGEVAALYGVDESTVHRWERNGRLRGARRDPGGGKYWLEAEILEDPTRRPGRSFSVGQGFQRGDAGRRHEATETAGWLMGQPTIEVPKRIRDTLRRQGAYDFGLGVVLRNPTDVNGTGGAASYRVEYRLEPVIPGRPQADRKRRYARSLEKAYVVATEIAEEMRERAAGTFVEYHTDVCFGDVVTRWLDAPHPRWGEQYPDKVRSLLKNWVLAGDITVNWPSRLTGTPLAKVPIGALTADHYNQAFEHVRTARAHRTYTEVHGLVIQILKWAITNRYLRPDDQNTLAHLHLAREQRVEQAEGMVRAIAPDDRRVAVTHLIGQPMPAGDNQLRERLEPGGRDRDSGLLLGGRAPVAVAAVPADFDLKNPPNG